MNTHTTTSRRSAALLLGTSALLAGGLGTAGACPAPTDPAVRAQAPDLAVTSVTPTTTRAEAGWGVDVRATVRNVGGGTTPAGVVRFWLSKDTKPGRGDIRLDPDVPIAGLAAGQEVVIPPTLNVPSRAKPGSYRVLACVVVPGKARTGAERGGKVGKANDCRASTKRVQIEAPIQGRLIGRLDFDRTRSESSTNSSETVTEHASVSIDVRVDGRERGWDVFANDGSTWSFEGSAEKITRSSDCEVTATAVSHGAGTLRQTGDQYEDDLLGSFKLRDHSQISLLIGLRYDLSERTRTVPTEELGCRPSDQTTGPKTLRQLNDLDLRQVQRTKKAIVYTVSAARGSDGTQTPWDTVTGELTLDLK